MKESDSILKPIKWFDCKSGEYCDAFTIICEYTIYKYGSDTHLSGFEDNEKVMDKYGNSWVVAYYNRQTEAPTKEALGFNTMQDAKEWCWDNYKMHMQPYFNCKL